MKTTTTRRITSNNGRKSGNAILLLSLFLTIAFVATVHAAASNNGRDDVVPSSLQFSPIVLQQHYQQQQQLQLRGGGGTGGINFLSRRPPRITTQNMKQQQQQQSSASATTTNNSRSSSVTTSSSSSQTKDAMNQLLPRSSRNTFIARVYMILAVQLAVTAAVVGIFGTNPGLTSWMLSSGLGMAVPIVSLLLSTIAWVIMSISVDARRRAPIKWQILTLFTIGESISVGFISSFYTLASVGSAMLATATAAIGVSAYTLLQKNPKYDLSQWGATLSSMGLIFMVYGLIQIFSMIGILPKGFLPYNDAMYGIAGSTLFSFYLAYHSRLIVAGKHTKYQMNEKDYIFGAMTLYNDIINIFIYLLKVVGVEKD